MIDQGMTQSQSVLDGLVERLGKSTGPDRELDFLIQTHVANPLTGNEGYTLQDIMDDFALLGAEGMTIDAPYTASVDAALALVERKLPGPRWCWKLVQENGRHVFVLRNAPWLTVVAPAWTASHERAPIAILLATLSALQSLEAK